MDTRLGHIVLERLVQKYGNARIIGSIYRWGIQTSHPDFPIILALDACCDAYVTAWVFDARQKPESSITHFTIRSPAHVEPAIREICATIERLMGDGESPQRPEMK